jgi:hypothetical protein
MRSASWAAGALQGGSGGAPNLGWSRAHQRRSEKLEAANRVHADVLPILAERAERYHYAGSTDRRRCGVQRGSSALTIATRRASKGKFAENFF